LRVCREETQKWKNPAAPENSASPANSPLFSIVQQNGKGVALFQIARRSDVPDEIAKKPQKPILLTNILTDTPVEGSGSKQKLIGTKSAKT